MDKSNFTVEDFVLDSDFREWILFPNKRRNLKWEDYINKNPQSLENIRVARQIVLNMPASNYKMDEHQVDGLWDAIEGKLETNEKIPEESESLPLNSQATISRFEKQQSNTRSKFNFLKVAAILVFGLILGLLYYSQAPEEETPEVHWLTFSTKPGVKSSLKLSDGTVVKLNSGSTIKYVKDFVGDTREIFLEGEAFFEVAHDTLKPFIVHTQDISTKALGTSFNIKAGQGGKIAISLITGKVEVKSEDVPDFLDYLIPGEQIQALAHSKSWEKSAFDSERVMAWLDQTIIFDKTPLPEAVKMLENWFGVEISILNFEDENLTISGKYKGETLNNILDGLSYTARFNYEIKGKEIQINFQQ
ncbi:FecR family protein [Algoriphagus machipongonensis]|uniref:Anti-sigma factor n=1 Tax=Algoriphagus machipongonensis TaxID=388413 RepID=A3I018_9BACT|nr:FecR family protein [Algoriphagus machipongonensis]EAZ80854.1 putative anti-sigma factor [Algoriphagus machipongonensis]